MEKNIIQMGKKYFKWKNDKKIVQINMKMVQIKKLKWKKCDF